MLTTRRQWAPLYERHEERYRSPQRNSQSCSVADVRLSAWSKNRLPDRSALCGWCHEEVPTPDKESAAPSPTFWGSWARCLCCRCRQAHVCACAPSAFLTPFYVQCDQLLKGTHECRALAKFPRRGVYNEADVECTMKQTTFGWWQCHRDAFFSASTETGCDACAAAKTTPARRGRASNRVTHCFMRFLHL